MVCQLPREIKPDTDGALRVVIDLGPNGEATVCVAAQDEASYREALARLRRWVARRLVLDAVDEAVRR